MPKHAHLVTDNRRFQPAPSPPDTCHRHYYGALQVELVFRLADLWLQRRAAWDARSGRAESKHIAGTLNVFSRR